MTFFSILLLQNDSLSFLIFVPPSSTPNPSAVVIAAPAISLFTSDAKSSQQFPTTELPNLTSSFTSFHSTFLIECISGSSSRASSSLIRLKISFSLQENFPRFFFWDQMELQFEILAQPAPML